jgi:hypothetical protein
MPQFQLFTIPRMFRNQQVAGSIPAGGSKNQHALTVPEVIVGLR